MYYFLCMYIRTHLMLSLKKLQAEKDSGVPTPFTYFMYPVYLYNREHTIIG